MDQSTHVYILELGNGSLYVGTSRVVPDRLARHAGGAGSLAARMHGVSRLLYSELHPSRSSAARREHQLKGWTRAKKLALARGRLDELKRLSRRKT